MNATLVALLVITVAIVSVSATSPQNCASVTCNPHICRRVECGCGRYSDECGCCDLCYKGNLEQHVEISCTREFNRWVLEMQGGGNVSSTALPVLSIILLSTP
ncbi:uncharacterized protein LOC119452938 isoform X12 [Dermacentor silvarum]|uniref:uncharacterized protein LOC119452938 isoform X12 n=1 Tax=Dermacentor silvarum TaxID=543639 RepID=UPI002100FDAC|nr:uncharacterized protein LOC119452938 isoform X12 [Dermacentor silvarum]